MIAVIVAVCVVWERPCLVRKQHASSVCLHATISGLVYFVCAGFSSQEYMVQNERFTIGVEEIRSREHAV